jgi:hypothetical protein
LAHSTFKISAAFFSLSGWLPSRSSEGSQPAAVYLACAYCWLLPCSK